MNIAITQCHEEVRPDRVVVTDAEGNQWAINAKQWGNFRAKKYQALLELVSRFESDDEAKYWLNAVVNHPTTQIQKIA